MQSDQQLVAEALEGSQDAYRELVRRYATPLFRLVRRMVRDDSLAEDLTQETLVKAFAALGSYDPGRRLASWLFKIAHNTTIDHLRRGQLATTPLAAEEGDVQGPLDRLADPSLPSPEERARGADLARDLTAAVAALDLRYRELVLLRFQEGLEYQEIAEVTGLPLGTVKTRLHRGRKRLAELLAERGWTP
ncbi:MAG TPA: sigma-70 family RNA polymerase sigma factor [Thermoanaerobaculia bacterium]|nr:sigma-70 family RNA polymerase sigma factor [Thermoanaerobaculia bacterium]